MNQKILNMFNPESEDFDVYKEFEFIEKVQDGELEISNYIDEFIYLLNNIYLEDGADSELELFMESVEPELLVSKVLKTFENMDTIDPIFDWEKFLFDNDSFSFTLKYAKMMENKNSFEVYLDNLLKDSAEFIKYDNAKKRVENMKFVKQNLVLK